MVALNVTFAVIVVVLTLGIILFVASGTFGDIKTAFEKFKSLPEIPVSAKDATCATGTTFSLMLSAEVGRPAFSKRTELLPVFIFNGKVYASTPEKITLEESEKSVEFVSSESITTSVPKQGQSFLLALVADDEKCRNLIKSKPSFDQFAKECGQFIQTVKSLPVEGLDCVAPEVLGGAPLPALKFDGAQDIGGNMCEVRFTVSNLGRNAWTEDDGIKAVIDCVQLNYIPPVGAGFLVIHAGGSIKDYGTRALRTCPKWNEAELRSDAQLWSKYQDGWKIKLYRNCPDERCSGAEEIKSTDFRC